MLKQTIAGGDVKVGRCYVVTCKSIGVSIEQRLQVGVWAELDSLGAGAEEQVAPPEGTSVAFAWGRGAMPSAMHVGMQKEKS